MHSRRLFTAMVLMLCTLACAAAASGEEYLIGDEDMLQISVWGNQELNAQVPVRPDGMISVPLAGDIRAAGVSTRSLKAVIEKELQKFVKNPTVTVIVTAVNSYKVYMLGEGLSGSALQSGVVSLRRNTTLMQLLAQCGSLKNADLRSSYLLRDGVRLPVDFAALALKGDATHDVPLKANDVIFIPDNFEKRITVVGGVKNPGIVSFREGLTALDAVLSVGGFNEFARQNDVVIVRRGRSEPQTIEVRLRDVVRDGDITKDVALMPGDLVIVKTGIF